MTKLAVEITEDQASVIVANNLREDYSLAYENGDKELMNSISKMLKYYLSPIDYAVWLDGLREEQLPEITYPKSAELLKIIANTTFSPFTKGDWYSFAGCETKDPMIGYYDEFTIVLDGNLVNIVHNDDSYGGQLFKLEQV